MGADMFCYATCPNGYMANTTYHCVACSNCGGLTFSLAYKIIKDALYLYLTFTEVPDYVFTPPQLSLSPALPYESINSAQQLVGKGKVGATGTQGSTNITFIVNTKTSLTATYLTVTFQNQLTTFNNPLQAANSTLFIEGYDYYPTDLRDFSNLGVLVLLIAVLGLAKNPFMLDFAQTLFLIGLVNFHYPSNLASFLEGTSIAHLHGLVSIEQPNSLGEGKFLYLTGTGLLSNTLTNWLIILIFLGVSLVLYVIFVIAQKRMNYSRVDDESHLK